MEFIWNDECPLNSLDLIPLDYHVWTAVLEIYQCYTAKPTDTYEVKTGLQVIWADLRQDPILCSNTVVQQKDPDMQKAIGGHFEYAV